MTCLPVAPVTWMFSRYTVKFLGIAPVFATYTECSQQQLRKRVLLHQFMTVLVTKCLKELVRYSATVCDS